MSGRIDVFDHRGNPRKANRFEVDAASATPTSVLNDAWKRLGGGFNIRDHELLFEEAGGKYRDVEAPVLATQLAAGAVVEVHLCRKQTGPAGVDAVAPSLAPAAATVQMLYRDVRASTKKDRTKCDEAWENVSNWS